MKEDWAIEIGNLEDWEVASTSVVDWFLSIKFERVQDYDQVCVVAWWSCLHVNCGELEVNWRVNNLIINKFGATELRFYLR